MTNEQAKRYALKSWWMLKGQNLVSIAEVKDDGVVTKMKWNGGKPAMGQTALPINQRRYYITDASWLTPVPEKYIHLCK